MSIQRVILNYNNNHCVTAIPWVNLHKPTPPVKNWRTWCKVLLPHAPADGNQRIITIIHFYNSVVFVLFKQLVLTLVQLYQSAEVNGNAACD